MTLFGQRGVDSVADHVHALPKTAAVLPTRLHYFERFCPKSLNDALLRMLIDPLSAAPRLMMHKDPTILLLCSLHADSGSCSDVQVYSVFNSALRRRPSDRCLRLLPINILPSKNGQSPKSLHRNMTREKFRRFRIVGRTSVTRSYCNFCRALDSGSNGPHPS
jgi:hypothetical protein